MKTHKKNAAAARPGKFGYKGASQQTEALVPARDSTDGFALRGAMSEQRRVLVLAPEQHPIEREHGLALQGLVTNEAIGFPVGIHMESGFLAPGASGLLIRHTVDTALAVQAGELVVISVEKGTASSAVAKAGDGIYIPAGLHHVLFNGADCDARFIAARSAGHRGDGIVPGNGCGPLTVIPPERQNQETGHGIPRRWLVSEVSLGHPTGIGLTWGEVPGGSAGHFHSHPVDTAILILTGRVLVPSFEEGYEANPDTEDAAQGCSIFIPANFVHGPAVPFAAPMSYFAARPVGNED